MPGFVPQEGAPSEAANEGGGNGQGGGGGGGSGAVDPIIGGLLARLPKSGSVWPESERKLWLQLLEGSFKLIYKDGLGPRPDYLPASSAKMGEKLSNVGPNADRLADAERKDD
jgi:hypothetical protein